MALWSHILSLSGGGGVPKRIIKGKNPCSNMGDKFDIMGRCCNTCTSRLRCRAVRITLFNFIARGFEGMLFRENVYEMCNWVHSRVYFDIIM